MAREIFGVPTMFVGEDLYWGADRLDMVEVALGGSIARETGVARVPVDFYFDYSSPFAYLALTRAEQVFGEAGRWRPILLGGLFRSIGTVDVPLFTQSPAKRRHTMQDLGRQARWLGGEFKWPSRFPVSSVLALRVAKVLAAAMAVSGSAGTLTQAFSAAPLAVRLGYTCPELSEAMVPMPSSG